MIYCVEDERNIRELVVYTLETSGFKVKGFAEAKSFFEELEQCLPELVLLDIMLPGEDGMDILKKLKEDEKTAEIPVIMVTAKGTEYDKVLGLDCGADDYITKPFGMMEFIARVKAVLRRGTHKAAKHELETGCLKVNVEQHTVKVDDELIPLTLKEFELLRYLMENSGKVVTRHQILVHIWGYDFDGETRTVDVHVRTLRQKLGKAQSFIETVRGVGYRIGGCE